MEFLKNTHLSDKHVPSQMFIDFKNNMIDVLLKQGTVTKSALSQVRFKQTYNTITIYIPADLGKTGREMAFLFYQYFTPQSDFKMTWQSVKHIDEVARNSELLYKDGEMTNKLSSPARKF